MERMFTIEVSESEVETMLDALEDQILVDSDYLTELLSYPYTTLVEVCAMQSLIMQENELILFLRGLLKSDPGDQMFEDQSVSADNEYNRLHS